MLSHSCHSPSIHSNLRHGSSSNHSSSSCHHRLQTINKMRVHFRSTKATATMKASKPSVTDNPWNKSNKTVKKIPSKTNSKNSLRSQMKWYHLKANLNRLLLKWWWCHSLKTYCNLMKSKYPLTKIWKSNTEMISTACASSMTSSALPFLKKRSTSYKITDNTWTTLLTL